MNTCSGQKITGNSKGFEYNRLFFSPPTFTTGFKMELTDNINYEGILPTSVSGGSF